MHEFWERRDCELAGRAQKTAFGNRTRRYGGIAHTCIAPPQSLTSLSTSSSTLFGINRHCIDSFSALFFASVFLRGGSDQLRCRPDEGLISQATSRCRRANPRLPAERVHLGNMGANRYGWGGFGFKLCFLVISSQLVPVMLSRRSSVAYLLHFLQLYLRVYNVVQTTSFPRRVSATRVTLGAPVGIHLHRTRCISHCCR